MSDQRAGTSRADRVAAEADQAHAMMRRVSPEGRAEARRLREARSRRVRGLALGWLAIAVAVFLLYSVADRELGPFGADGFAGAIAVMLAACAILAFATRARTVAEPPSADAPMELLPDRLRAWATAQRPRLPAPAAATLDGIGARLDALAPHLAAAGPGSMEADALRRLVGGELPALVDQYRAVPTPLRAEPGPNGTSPDARLLHGLATVERRLTELTREAGAGALDGLSTHDRYLDAKYRPDEPLGR